MHKVFVVLLGIVLAIFFAALCAFPGAGVLYLVYKLILRAIFPALPVITFWQMYFIFWALATIGGLFRSSTTVKKN